MDTITCPSCGRHLRIAAEVQDRWLSCPHCLASIANPRRDHAPPAAVIAPAEPAMVRRACPECGEPVEPAWRFCPNCDARLRRPRRRLAEPALDVEVRSDSHVSAIVLGVLAVLSIVGVGLFLASGGLDLVNFTGPAGAHVLLLGGAVVGVVVVGVGVLVWTSKGAGTKALSGMLGGLTIGLSIALTFAVLLLLAIWSACIGILEACSRGCSPPPHH
jgi:hypothetical protein